MIVNEHRMKLNVHSFTGAPELLTAASLQRDQRGQCPSNLVSVPQNEIVVTLADIDAATIC